MIKKINIAIILVRNDIKIFFRESYLGTLWQSLFLLVQVLAMGPLFASIFSAKIGVAIAHSLSDLVLKILFSLFLIMGALYMLAI